VSRLTYNVFSVYNLSKEGVHHSWNEFIVKVYVIVVAKSLEIISVVYEGKQLVKFLALVTLKK
jgi:hypothetical protein